MNRLTIFLILLTSILLVGTTSIVYASSKLSPPTEQEKKYATNENGVLKTYSECPNYKGSDIDSEAADSRIYELYFEKLADENSFTNEEQAEYNCLVSIKSIQEYAVQELSQDYKSKDELCLDMYNEPGIELNDITECLDKE